jgi:holo-[acyl-carrier protein] synthase
MIVGIGVDLTRIVRHEKWALRSPKRLEKLFSPTEIAYCLNSAQSAERFAVRFAAKEAFYKALGSWLTEMPSLLRICKAVQVTYLNNRPELVVDWHNIGCQPLKTHLSLSHERDQAVAFVVLTHENANSL